MGFKLYILLQVFWTILPIWASFKDFVIENERDLQRFGEPNGEMLYDDEDLEYQLLNDNGYEDELYGAVGGSCGSHGDMSSGYDVFKGIGEEEYDGAGVSIPGYEGNINGAILKEVIRQLANDPRFQHLKDHLTEDELLISFNDDKYNQDLLAPDYVDVNEDEHNSWYGEKYLEFS